MKFAELPKCATIDDIRAIEHVDMVVTLSEVVERQKARLNFPNAVIAAQPESEPQDE